MDIKHAVKKKMNYGSKINPDLIYKKIKKYDYISFDLFDTLVKRNVEEPTDVFDIVEKKVGGDFKKKRILAERKARIESDKREILIDDIYSYFPESKRERIKTIELDTEFYAIVPNQDMLTVYKKCIEDGKTVFITSDMYWEEKYVRSLLEKNGYQGYKRLFLSSSEQAVKSDGSLYKNLLNKEQLKAENLIHIGDSKKSDYDEPRKLGVNAIRIPRYVRNIVFRGDNRNDVLELNYLNHFIGNTVPSNVNPYYLFGYSQFGKLLFGYVNWIYEEAIKKGIHKIYFFARDGYIMKQAYEACINDNSIETRYLEVSRRSLRCPILWMDCSFETILKTLVNAKLVSLESIFDGLGLELEKYSDVIKQCGLTTETVFDRKTIWSDKRLKNLINTINQDIINNSKKECDLLEHYLKENKVEGRFGVVDIGYGGSMQRYLQQVLSQLGVEHDISGFYLGVADFYTKNLIKNEKFDLNGYLFDFQHDKSAVDKRSSFVGLFETLFLEQNGSVEKYLCNDNHIEAVRYPYEYEVDGKPTEDLLKVRQIQMGALDFVKRAAEDKLLLYLKCKPDEYFYGIYKTGTDPQMDDIKMFGDILFYDEGYTQKLVAPKRLLYYVVRPRDLKDDFLRSRWKIGFMKKIMRIKLPYQNIYLLLRRIG